jgi:hypothetical protein
MARLLLGETLDHQPGAASMTFWITTPRDSVRLIERLGLHLRTQDRRRYSGNR